MKVYIYENLKDMCSHENYFLILSVTGTSQSVHGGMVINTEKETYMFPSSVFCLAVEEESE